MCCAVFSVRCDISAKQTCYPQINESLLIVHNLTIRRFDKPTQLRANLEWPHCSYKMVSLLRLLIRTRDKIYINGTTLGNNLSLADLFTVSVVYFCTAYALQGKW